MFNRIKAYIRRRRTRKQIKKMGKAGREAAERFAEANNSTKDEEDET